MFSYSNQPKRMFGKIKANAVGKMIEMQQRVRVCVITGTLQEVNMYLMTDRNFFVLFLDRLQRDDLFEKIAQSRKSKSIHCETQNLCLFEI